MNTKNPVKKIGASLLLTLALITLIYLLLPNGRSVGAAPQMQPGPTSNKALAASVRADQKQMRMALGQLPLSFEMNRGQFDPQVQFASRGAGYKAFLTQTEAVFVLKKPATDAAQADANEKNALEKIKGATHAERSAELKRLREEQAAQRAASKAVVRMSLVGANLAPQVSGLDELPGKINYFRGKDEQKWITDIPTFRRVKYAGVYPGIDMVYYGKGRDMEYDLVVAPGADPNRIGFNFDGAERVEVDAATGGLVISAAGGAQLRQGKPLFYQEIDGVKHAITGSFTTMGNRAGFAVGDYDKTRPLVIDPVLFTYSTYLGAESNDRGHDIAADSDGNAYVVGWTESDEFPTKNAYQAGNNNSSQEAFVTKFNPDGSQLIWSTYLGGGSVNNPFSETSAADGAYGVALDSARNVYVTGFTNSRDFPTRNAMQPELSDANESDSFITKINAAGNQLVFSTYFGGSDGTDVGRGIALDGNNNVYVVGYTNSFVFPTTNPIQKEIDSRTKHSSVDSNFDAYLAKIDASGQFRVYSTYIGGGQDDVALGVAVDANGAAYVTGWTESTRQDQPGPNPIAEFAIPTKNSGANGITAGPDGNIYFTERLAGNIGRLNIPANPTATPTLEEFVVGSGRGLNGISSNPDGTPAPDTTHVFFGEGNNVSMGELDLSAAPTPAISEVGVSACNVGVLTHAPNGKIYYSQSSEDGSACSQFGEFNPANNSSASYGTASSISYGITIAPDGYLYYTDGGNQIVKFDPAGSSQLNVYATSLCMIDSSRLTPGPGGDIFFTGGCDSRIARLNPTTGDITYYNSPDNETASGITAGPDGHIYFTQRTANRIGRLNPSTGVITLFRIPTPNSQPRDIVAGPDGNLYFTEFDGNKIGRFKLNPATPDPAPLPLNPDLFPTTNGAFQEVPGGTGYSRDAFVVKVDPAGTQYLYSTFLGGAARDVGWGIALGSDRSAFVTGYTNSGATPIPQQTNGATVAAVTQDDFPTTANAYQPKNNGGYDAFLSRLAADGSALIYSTYIGGDQNEGGDGECLECTDRIDGGAVAVDFANNAYITGWTESTFVPGPRDGAKTGPAAPTAPKNFPTTPDAAQPSPGSSPNSSGTDARDAFVSKFNTDKSGTDSLVYSTFLGGSHQDEGQGIALDPGANTYVTGWTLTGLKCVDCGAAAAPLQVNEDNDFPTTPGAFQEEPANNDDGFVTKVVITGFNAIGQGQGFIISGKVTLADDGSPLQGVIITLDRPDGTTNMAVTDANGIYSFSNLPPVPESPYIVTPDKAGNDPYDYEPPSRDVIVTNQNERADFVASLPPEPTPTATATATATATPTATATASATATATATPTATAASQAINLSTRLNVLTGDQVGIGGFIVTGSGPKHVIVRAIGPDLKRFGIPNPLPDPVLELHGPGAFATITNNNWRDTQEAQIKATGLAPTNDLESAIDIILSPGSYTGIIRGNGGSTGIGLIEVYDLDQAATAKLSNISTRGFVGSTPGDSIIAGFILGNSNAPDRIIIRGLGPSLTAVGVPNVLANPTLELHNGDGALLYTNNDWQDNPSQAAEIAAAGLAPKNNLEAAISVTLPPGLYTAILAGLGSTTGNGLVEIYDRGTGP